jgi:hypothetical protein
MHAGAILGTGVDVERNAEVDLFAMVDDPGIIIMKTMIIVKT